MKRLAAQVATRPGTVATGTKRTLQLSRAMPAFGGKADIGSWGAKLNWSAEWPVGRLSSRYSSFRRLADLRQEVIAVALQLAGEDPIGFV